MFRDINIKPALNGFIVVCGCQVLVFNSSEDLTKALKAYLDDPSGEEKRMLKEGLNAKHTVSPQLEEAMPARAVEGAGQAVGASIREAHREVARASLLGGPFGGDLVDSVGGQAISDERRVL